MKKRGGETGYYMTALYPRNLTDEHSNIQPDKLMQTDIDRQRALKDSRKEKPDAQTHKKYPPLKLIE